MLESSLGGLISGAASLEGDFDVLSRPLSQLSEPNFFVNDTISIIVPRVAWGSEGATPANTTVVSLVMLALGSLLPDVLEYRRQSLNEVLAQAENTSPVALVTGILFWMLGYDTVTLSLFFLRFKVVLFVVL